MDESYPLVSKQRGLLNKYVIAGIAGFCIFFGIIIGISVISHYTAGPAHTDNSQEFGIENSFVNSTFAYTVPCSDPTACGSGPSGCASNRVVKVKCNSINSNGYPTIRLDDSTACGAAPVVLQQRVNVQFYQLPGTEDCYEITMQVGECWGTLPKTGGVYNCQGQCGPSCISGCNILTVGSWSRNCLRHDVCSWYFCSTNGGSNTYCGKSFKQASGDYSQCGAPCRITQTHTCNF